MDEEVGLLLAGRHCTRPSPSYGVAMHGEFFLLEDSAGSAFKAKRLPLGDTRGRNEAWLRDTLYNNPEILPIGDIEPSFGPLLPLCTELRTPAGPLDIAFINALGRLTLVECKLWRNPEARRKVIAQVLDYARAIKQWSYADLQRQVSIATGIKRNVPFEIARQANPTLLEQDFIDNVSRSMRHGRFLLLVAGDGIREDLGSIAELINRNASSAFSLGLVEVALYEFPEGKLAIQPRAIGKTQVIERTVIIANTAEGAIVRDDEGSPSDGVPEPGRSVSSGSSIRDAEVAWWTPVTDMIFDDPDQESPRYRWRNHVRVDLGHGVWLVAYLPDGGATLFLSGNREALDDAIRHLKSDPDLLPELPAGAGFNTGSKGEEYISAGEGGASFADDDARREWIRSALNQFVNALRPRLKALS